MTFFNRILVAIQDFLESIFSSSSPEYKKKHQLKLILAQVRSIEPPLYRQDGMLLPPFPATLYQIYQFMQPINEILSATVANPDRRVAERYRDYLLELALTPEQRQLRKSFTFEERTRDLVAQPLPPERAIEEQGKQFASFLKVLDSASMRQAGVLLLKIDALADFCQFDFNAFFSNFDPAFTAHEGQDTTVESPSFHSVEVAEIVPLLLDLYYLLVKLDLGAPVVDVVSILEAKRRGNQLNEEIRNKMNRIVQAVIWLLQKRMPKDILLSVIRLVKDDPEFVPQQPQFAADHLARYREHITELFHSDSNKLVKEQQDNEISTMVRATFGERRLETIEGYSEETNALLQEFTLYSLEWIKPIQIIKTFNKHYFEPHFKQILRSVIVEGYFSDRTLQSSLSSAYYYCEAVTSKMGDFERLFGDNQPCSVKILTGYLTELEKGMDFEKPLQKMVENMNNHAKAFIQQAVTNFAEVFNFSIMLMADNKKTVPDMITNIRTLSGSSKNMDSFGWLEKETGVFRNFLEIMKRYAILGTLSVPASLTEKMES